MGGMRKRDFPCDSAGNESACNEGDLGSIPGLGRSPGEEIGYQFQYSWISLVAKVVKNPPAMQESWVQSLGWEDLLEKGKATHSNILAWGISKFQRIARRDKKAFLSDQCKEIEENNLMEYPSYIFLKMNLLLEN